jgi:hypothetical protein
MCLPTRFNQIFLCRYFKSCNMLRVYVFGSTSKSCEMWCHVIRYACTVGNSYFRHLCQKPRIFQCAPSSISQTIPRSAKKISLYVACHPHKKLLLFDWTIFKVWFFFGGGGGRDKVLGKDLFNFGHVQVHADCRVKPFRPSVCRHVTTREPPNQPSIKLSAGELYEWPSSLIKVYLNPPPLTTTACYAASAHTWTETI